MGAFLKTDRLKIILVCLLFLSVRLPGLGTDISNSDAARWHRRSVAYFRSLFQGDLKGTLPAYHPGIPLMWIGGAAEAVGKAFPATTSADAYVFVHTVSKVLLIFILLFLLIIQMGALSILFGPGVSLWYGLIISAEPYMVGINRWFHLSSLEIFLGFTSILLILLWKKTTKSYLLLFSVLFFVLSFLTKTTSLILAPVFFVVFFQDYLKRKIFTDIFKFVFFTVTLTVLFMPVLVFNPEFAVNKLFSGIDSAISEDVRTGMLPPGIIPFFYIIILGFKLSPISVILFPIAIWCLRRKLNFEAKIVLLMSALYYLALSFSVQKIDRYSLVFIPTIALFISMWVSNLKKNVRILIAVSYLVALAYNVWAYYPVLSAYYSPLFGGTSQALKMGFYDNSGEYFAQAAGYLNTKGTSIHTFVPDNIESFSVFFKGESQTVFDEKTNYILRSLDTDRKYFESPLCSTLEKSFGSKEYKVVNVYLCR